MRILTDPCLHDRWRPLAALLPGLLLAGAGCSAADVSDDRPEARDTARSSIGAAATSAEVVVAEAVLQPAAGHWPAAALGGAQYLVVWEDYRSGRNTLYAGRAGLDGAALDPFGIPLLDLPLEEYSFFQYEPAVAFDGTNFLVVAAVSGKLHGVRVSRTGEVLDPGGFPIATTGSRVSRPSVVFDGQQYLVAWSRGAAPALFDSGIYHARVSPDGTVLDPEGVLDYPLAHFYTPVAVSFDGTHSLLSWVDIDAGTQSPSLYAARIDADGEPVNQTPLRVSPSGLQVVERVSPAAGFDGANHVLAWHATSEDEDGYPIFEVMVGRVSPDGQRLDPAGIVLRRESLEATDVHRLEVTAGNGRTIVTWSQDYGGEGGPAAEQIQVAQIAADGTPSAHPADGYTRGLEATLVTDPEGGMLLWRDGDALYSYYPLLAGTRLDATGAPVPGSAVAPASTASRQVVRGVATDGEIFFVVWADGRDPRRDGEVLYGARIAANGTPLDGDGIALGTGAAHVSDVVFDGASFLVAWTEHTGGEGDGSPFRFVRVSPDGALVATPPQPELLASPGYTMASASDGTHTLLVGQDYNSARSLLAALLVDQQGAAVGSVIDIVTEGPAFNASGPAVSFDGTSYLVVWNDQREVFGQRVSASGALVGGRISIARKDWIEHATTAAGGGNHLVVWQDKQGIFAARVSPAGEVLDPEGRLITPHESLCLSGGCCVRPDLSSGTCPSVAFDGTRFFVAWRAPSTPGDEDSFDLYGAEVTPAGDVLRTFPISEEPEHEGAPYLVAGAGERVLAAYTRFVPGAPYDARRARARLLESGGGPIPGPDAGPIDPAPDAGGAPADPGDGGGDCGCTVGGAQPAPVAPLLLLGSVLGLWLVRRRSAR